MKTLRIHPTTGQHIEDLTQWATELAKSQHVCVKYVFNGVPITVTKKSDAETVVREYHRKLKERLDREGLPTDERHDRCWNPYVSADS